MFTTLNPTSTTSPDDDFYKWKDGYAGQEAVLYDNMSPTNIKPTRLLKEIDRYFIQVPIKGGFIGWRPRRIYITTTYHPDHMAAEGGFSLPAEFTRRLTHVKDLGSKLDFAPPKHL